jgi:hypothetical protein
VQSSFSTHAQKIPSQSVCCIAGLDIYTVVSELAGDNGKRETRAMGIVMAMWGWGFLFCPAISGTVAEPTRQYANWWQQQQQDNGNTGWKFHFLDTFPFILPNLIGALTCLVSMLLVALFVPETLPRDKRRGAKYIAEDLFRSFHRSILSVISEVSESRENSGLLDMDDGHDDDDDDGKETKANYNSIQQADNNNNDNDHDEDDDFELPSNIMSFVKDDVQGAIRASIQSYNEGITMLHTITGEGRGSITNAALRRASYPEHQSRFSDMLASSGTRRPSSLVSSALTPETPDDIFTVEEATIKSLWARVNTRNHMIVCWYVSNLWSTNQHV